MTIAELLADAFGRIRDAVHQAVDGLTPGQLAFRPDNGSNSIAWLVWHLTRIQDDHIADVAGTGQVWTAGVSGSTWADRFGLPFAASATGYGHGPEAVAAVQVRSGELLTGYYDAVHQETLDYVQGLTDADLDARRGQGLGSAGHSRRAPGECDLRRPAARRPGGIPARHHRARLTLCRCPRLSPRATRAPRRSSWPGGPPAARPAAGARPPRSRTAPAPWCRGTG